jgi:hypothetical protein
VELTKQTQRKKKVWAQKFCIERESTTDIKSCGERKEERKVRFRDVTGLQSNIPPEFTHTYFTSGLGFFNFNSNNNNINP